MTNSTEDIYLGRQPILDREQNLYGFELLFRSGTENRANVTDDLAATSAVIIHTLSEFGIETVLGKHPGFINCDSTFLQSDAVELLPPEKVILEILETTIATESLQQRCLDLKAKGYRLALDDFRGITSANRPFLSMADIIKVDILRLHSSRLEAVTQEIIGLPATLLAEKVETHEDFVRCSDLGYHLFQGYYFARSENVASKRMLAGHLTIIQILALIHRDVDLAEIEEVFKQHPNLGINLLRLANSAAIGLREPLRSLGHAIVVLGRRQLERWLLLLMLSEGNPGRAGKQSSLIHLAATRGKFMELLALSSKYGSGFADSAFVTGIVSVMDVLLGISREELVNSLGLVSEVKMALMQHEGRLGELLNLAIALEVDDQDTVVGFFSSNPHCSFEMMNQDQGLALAWANKIVHAV